MYLERLQMLCEKNNTSMTELSKHIGIDRSVIGKYISGYLVSMPLTHLNSICNYFDVSIDYILQLTESPKYKRLRKNIDTKLFAERLIKFRKQEKITQNKLASVLNCNRSVLSDYENQKRLISISLLYEICRKYKISADYLLGKMD